MESFQALVKGCLNGDAKSQKHLYDLYAPKMMSICSRYANNDAEAAYILQDGFVKVFMNLKQLENPEQIERWIKGIMVNTALDSIRKKKPHLGKEVEMYENYDKGADEDITGQISAEEIIQLIQTLPEGYRMIFNMYAIEGYSHPEIAEKLGITAGTSKSQYARAKKLLQEKTNKASKTMVKQSS